MPKSANARIRRMVSPARDTIGGNPAKSGLAELSLCTVTELFVCRMPVQPGHNPVASLVLLLPSSSQLKYFNQRAGD